MLKLPSSRMALSFDSSLLSTFLNVSSFAALPLRTKEVDIPYFVQNFLLALLAYMESTATHLTLTFMSFCCIRIQSLYTLMEGLERDMFDKRYAVYLYVVDLRTELDGFGFLISYDGTYIMTVNADDTVTDFPLFKHFLFLYKNLSGNPVYTGVRFRALYEFHPSV